MGGLIDYVAGTFRDRSAQAVRFFLDTFVPSWVQGGGSHGYTSSYVAEGFRIYFTPGDTSTVYVQVSGEGCRKMEDSPAFRGWSDLMGLWVKDGFHATRFDIAFDDRIEQLSMLELRRKLEAGEYTSRFRDIEYGTAKKSGETSKDVIRLGSMHSTTRLLIYDKRLEQLHRGYGDPGHWIRFELRFYDKLASEFAAWLVENGSLSGAEGFLRGLINFREPSNNKQGARQPISDFWLQFLENSEKCALSIPKRVKSLQTMCERFRKHYAPTLAMLVLCMCEGRLYGPWLKDTLAHGWARLNQRQVALVRQSLGYLPGNHPLLPEGRGRT